MQKVGTAGWLARNYNFSKVSRFIDELVILNVESDGLDRDTFLNVAAEVTSKVFVPVALGGAIRTLADAEVYFQNGADKVVINSLLWQDPDVVRRIAGVYGEQAVVASIDYRGLDGGRPPHFRGAGAPSDDTLAGWMRKVASVGVGELLLNSVDRDGTGMGLDLGVMEAIPEGIHLPIVLMGGVGRTDHFRPGLVLPRVSGVATSNLFAFMGEGLSASRASLVKAGIDMASWA